MQLRPHGCWWAVAKKQKQNKTKNASLSNQGLAGVAGVAGGGLTDSAPPVGGKGQKHAAASHFCIYRMLASLNKQIVQPALLLTGLEAPLWIKKAKDEIAQYVDDMRSSGHTMLTFAQLCAPCLMCVWVALDTAHVASCRDVRRCIAPQQAPPAPPECTHAQRLSGWLGRGGVYP